MSDSITAVIVNYNRRDLLLHTLRSVVAQSTPPGDIIVIDNGSTDDSVTAVRGELGDKVQIECLADNSGSAGGFSYGIEVAIEGNSNQFLVMDSDVIMAPDCLEKLSAYLTNHPDVGIVGPKVYLWDHPGVLQMLGGGLDWKNGCIVPRFPFHNEPVAGIVSDDLDVDFVPACCLLTKRTAVERAGNFDSGWFLYWDDVDWCARVRRAGLRVSVSTSSSVRHRCGGANKRSLLPVYYEWRNRYLFFDRHSAPFDRHSAVNAVLVDHLLARFTCRHLGLERTANVMELGISDALEDVFGKRDLGDMDLRLDQPVATPQSTSDLLQVHHVIGSATEELASRKGLVLQDRFGKRLPASEAWALRMEFEGERERELPGLLERAGAAL